MTREDDAVLDPEARLQRLADALEKPVHLEIRLTRFPENYPVKPNHYYRAEVASPTPPPKHDLLWRGVGNTPENAVQAALDEGFAYVRAERHKRAMIG